MDTGLNQATEFQKPRISPPLHTLPRPLPHSPPPTSGCGDFSTHLAFLVSSFLMCTMRMGPSNSQVYFSPIVLLWPNAVLWTGGNYLDSENQEYILLKKALKELL